MKWKSAVALFSFCVVKAPSAQGIVGALGHFFTMSYPHGDGGIQRFSMLWDALDAERQNCSKWSGVSYQQGNAESTGPGLHKLIPDQM